MEINSTDDCLSLQNSLDCFSNWCNSIGLKINASKCRVMTFTRSRTPILCDNHISGIKILLVINNVVDLGFRLTSINLSPCPHIAMISSRAFKVFGFVMRLSKDFKLVKSSHCALVCPILEYRFIIWYPYTVSDSDQLERIQRKFLRFAGFVLGIPHFTHNYTNILNVLNLPSATLAEHRRILN